jgi:hypothetical protein
MEHVHTKAANGFVHIEDGTFHLQYILKSVNGLVHTEDGTSTYCKVLTFLYIRWQKYSIDSMLLTVWYMYIEDDRGTYPKYSTFLY